MMPQLLRCFFDCAKNIESNPLKFKNIYTFDYNDENQ